MRELRPYQIEAQQEFLERGNQLLALVMGAGKTAGAITSMRAIRRQRRGDHGFVFALKSIKYQWMAEIQKWDPRASVQVVDGDKFQRHRALNRAHQYNYTILHYQCLVNDWVQIMEAFPDGPDFVILDEATAIKNFTAKTSRRAKALGKRTDIRMALSGQPVENRPEELFSIMEFVDPTVLGNFHKFDRAFIKRNHFGKAVGHRNLHVVEGLLEGVMYRKSRDDIKEWLPELIDSEMPVILDATSQRLHRMVQEDLADAIEAALDSGVSGGAFDLAAHYGVTQKEQHMGMMGTVMSRMLAMRMISSHPLLLQRSAEDFDDPLSRMGSEYASELAAKGHLDKLPKRTAKFDALGDMVDEILAEDPRHKVVIFSFFKHMLTLIGEDLTERWRKAKEDDWEWVRIDGTVSATNRARAIEAFNQDPDTRVFLSSDAGAYGVDLNRGSHLICYDLPWSAGAMGQRVARIDRTSNEFEQIHVSYLYGAGTIEERMLRMLRQKQKVAKAFIDRDYDRATGTINLDLESLREFVEAA